MLFRRFSISLFIMLSIVGVVIYGGFRSMFANPFAAFNGNAPQITSKLATKQLDPPIDLRVTKATGLQTAVLAGGCFWGVEAVFEQLQGVSKVVSGFSGGSKDTANYQTVSGGESGHAEAVQITYDPLYAAEAYHQDFISHHPKYPYVVINDLPKLDRLRTEFPQLIRSSQS